MSTNDAAGGCILWTGTRLRSGYGIAWVRGHRTTAHRVAWEKANGRTIPAGLFVLHHCDNPPCVNPDHLFLGTAKDNTADMIAKGRDSLIHPHFGAENGMVKYPPKGERNPRAKLREANVSTIRAMAAEGHSYPEIARTFGVSRQIVGDIVTRKRWSHV